MLRALREKSSKTLSDVAESISVSIPYLSDVERGKRRPFRMDRLLVLADALRVDPLSLIEAAAADKGVFELKADPLSPRILRLGSILAQRWHLLTDAEYHAIDLILNGSDETKLSVT